MLNKALKKRREHSFKNRVLDFNKPIVIFDGAMGTSIQELNLKPEDFGGELLEGCNENLVITKPESIEEVHCKFLQAGCDIVETNTFGATSIVLSEYGLENKSFEINKKAALIANKAIEMFSTSEKPRFVAGSMGPTTKLPTLGHVDFDELKNSYFEQANGLIEGGIDLFLVETCQDVLQIKTALQAINEAQSKYQTEIPIMVSVTMETNGKMLVGTDIQSVLTILQPFPIFILGLNCATGPKLMKDHIKYLSENSPFIISCIPNAGLPENIGGEAHYHLTGAELKTELLSFIEEYGIRIIGGCCGTTPEHIKELSSLTNYKSNIKNNNSSYNNRGIRSTNNLFASSIYSSVSYKQENSFLIIGERLNASGSKKVRELLNINDWDGLVKIARNQVKENAHILDVNVDYVGRNGIEDMKELVSRLVTNVNLPLMLDSTEWEKMEAGLKMAGGKSILNSTNYEDGDERFYKVLELARKYGCGLVIGTIDEEGMARTAKNKFKIAQRAYNDAIQFGILPGELFFDPLALPISTGIEEDRNNGKETLEAIELIKTKLTDSHVILGVSNISFGLSPTARIVLNSVFLNECCNRGLDSAIISPSKILPLSKIDDKQRNICVNLIQDKRKYQKNICIYDPLTALTTEFAGITTSQARSSKDSLSNLPIEKRLEQHIIDGEKIGLENSLSEALKNYNPLDIINKYLLSGMKVVGELFGTGQMQLPFVLQSAETMKFAVSFLENYMDKSESKKNKLKLIIATVKGDVHDIGKNLVDIIVTNNGYEVINLGIKQDVLEIIKAQKLYKADCIAMSGLLVKSTAFMRDNLISFNENNISVPVILGGAALTPNFVNKDCSHIYKGQLIYGKDAFTDLKFIEEYSYALEKGNWDDFKGFLDGTPKGIILGEAYKEGIQTEKGKNQLTLSNKQKESETLKGLNTSRSSLIKEENSIQPPFIGYKILSGIDIPIDNLIYYLDKKALFSGQWQFKKTREQNSDDYKRFLNNKAEPILDYWLKKIKDESILKPAVTYGYFRCGRKGNTLDIYDSKGDKKLTQFIFPRQKSGKRLCIADFYRDSLNSIPQDYIPMQAVTMGVNASKYSRILYENNNYTDYLYFHGLAVQLAEALAEWTHSLIRKECGFLSEEPNNNKDILAQKYRGCRFSFGYPACPNVSDSSIQLELLNSHKIDLTIDKSDQLHPEQSTTAIVSFHSQARYFSA